MPARTAFLVVLLIATRMIGTAPAAIVVGLGEGGQPQVKTFAGLSGAVHSDFLAYGATFAGGVRVATGDVNGDGVMDIVTGTGFNSSHIKVFSGNSGAQIGSFFAFTPTLLGGVYVASGDVNGDNADDIIVSAGQGSPPHVRVFSGTTGRSFTTSLRMTAALMAASVSPRAMSTAMEWWTSSRPRLRTHRTSRCFRAAR